MKMLFCSDGSTQAENAVRFGALIAAAYQAETSILGITEKANQTDALLQALRCASDVLKENHLNAELIIKAGRPVREIVKRTQESKYDLIVIGATHKGRRGPWWMSARAYKIIESVEPPVLVVIGGRTALRRLLLCTGGGPPPNRMVEFGGDLARRMNAVVTLCHVLPEPPAMFADLIEREEDTERVLTSNSKLGRTLRLQKELLEKLGVTCEIRLRHGLVVPELMRELQQTEYDLVVTGSSPAQDRLRQYVMGDLTREIVNRAELPVLVLRTGPKQITHPLSDLISHLFKHAPKTSEGESLIL